jgi:hypothetical protein
MLLYSEDIMNRLVTGMFVALAMASGPAFACAEPPAAQVAEVAGGAKSRMVHPVADTKSKTVNSAAETKFEMADEDNSGILESAEVEAYRSTMAQIDTNKDGKISREEFAVAVKAGAIK